MGKIVKNQGSMKKLIRKCDKCGGKPEKTEPINLPDFEGEKCSECLLVVNWKEKEDESTSE